MAFYESERKGIIPLIIIVLLIAGIIGVSCTLHKGDDDDGKIGVNVTTGECKIDIVDTADKSLIGDVLDFVGEDGEERIYFEPGLTCRTEGFEVKNVGSIPVSFRVYISEDEINDKHEFEEAFELWITNDPSNLDNAEKLTEFTGKLSADQKSETYYLVVRMKESAGNEFQNKTYTGIGITVYAMQGNADAEEK